MNLYMYVASDPMNRTDPSGLASCAKNLSSDACAAAKAAEPTAVNNLRAASTALGKAAAGERLTRTERAIVARADRVFATRGMSAADRSAVLASASQKIGAVASELADPGTLYVPGQAGFVDYATEGRIGIGREFVAQSFGERVGTLQHAAAHSSGVAPSHRDLRLPNGETYYGGGTYGPSASFFRDSVANYITTPEGRRYYNPFGEADAYRCVTPGMTGCGF